MLKFLNTKVTFSEVPDEISLCIEISGCRIKCPGCHSPHLQEDVGEELTFEVLDKLINKNKGITCVCFMGGDNNIPYLLLLSDEVHKHSLKAAWYSGLSYTLDNGIIDRYSYQHFEYVKTGPYMEEYGPLTSKTTNQRMYKRVSTHPYKFEDITERFWK